MLPCNDIEYSVVHTKSQASISFLTKRTGEAKGDLEGLINPASISSLICFFISNYSTGLNLYANLVGALESGYRSIVWTSFNPLFGGNFVWSSAGRTSLRVLKNSINLGLISSEHSKQC